MKKHIITLFLICFAFGSSFAQNQNTAVEPEIEMKVSLLGYRFFKDGERLTWKELVKTTEAVEEANQLIKKARTQNLITNISAGVGGFMIGFPIGQKSNDYEPMWELAYIGGAILIAGFPFAIKAFNNVNKGIDNYNIAASPSTGYRFQPEMFVINNQNGIGLSLRF